LYVVGSRTIRVRARAVNTRALTASATRALAIAATGASDTRTRSVVQHCTPSERADYVSGRVEHRPNRRPTLRLVHQTPWPSTSHIHDLIAWYSAAHGEIARKARPGVWRARRSAVPDSALSTPHPRLLHPHPRTRTIVQCCLWWVRAEYVPGRCRERAASSRSTARSLAIPPSSLTHLHHPPLPPLHRIAKMKPNAREKGSSHIYTLCTPCTLALAPCACWASWTTPTNGFPPPILPPPLPALGREVTRCRVHGIP
jgi:hypothetical protein